MNGNDDDTTFNELNEKSAEIEEENSEKTKVSGTFPKIDKFGTVSPVNKK